MLSPVLKGEAVIQENPREFCEPTTKETPVFKESVKFC